MGEEIKQSLLKYFKVDDQPWSYKKRREQNELVHEFDYKKAEFDGLDVSQEESFGGDGQGDTRYVILKIIKDGVVSYWEIPGFYSSGEGSEFEPENLFEVEPFEKTVRDWRSK